METDKTLPRFDAEGVKRHYREQQEERWKQEGRREVVEFFNSMGFAQIDSAYVQEKLKAKLKEWGI